MEIKNLKTSDKDYFEIWTSYCGADLTGYINNQCIGELQTFKYNSKDNNLQNEPTNFTTTLSNEKGILKLECLLFSGTLSRLKSVMNKNCLCEFTAKYNNEYGDTLLINFPEIKYDSYSISSSIDKITTSLIIKYKVYKEPDIFEQYHKIIDVSKIKENPLISTSNLEITHKQQENTDYKLSIYVPKVAYEKDIEQSIDEYINDKYLYKTAHYDKLNYKQMYFDTMAYTNYPCAIYKGNALIFKGLCHELFEASKFYNKELEQTKEIDDKKIQCSMNMYITFDLNSKIKPPKEDEITKIKLDKAYFNVHGQNIEFNFNNNKCNIQENVNYNEAYAEICGSNISYTNFNDVNFHTAKYLSETYEINNITFKSNRIIGFKNLHIERITFTDGYNEEFNVNKKVIDEYNKKIGEELIINDTDN